MSGPNSPERAPDWEALNAYVDGELDGEAAAWVAAAVAGDARLARQVARLARLKAAVQSGPPQLSEPLPEPLSLDAVLAPRQWRRRRGSLAASLVLLALLGGALAVGLQRDSAAPPPSAVLARAELLHSGWLAEPARPGPPDAGLLLASLQRFGLPVQIPDLSDTRLRVAHVALLGEAGDILHVGYHGTRGCRVSLLALRSEDLRGQARGTPALPERLQRQPRPGGPAYLWRAGPVSYVLLADGMDAGRMEVIAGAIEQATRRHAPLPPETRTALADSRARSEACVG